MKKFDIVAILAVFLIALLFYVLYFINRGDVGDVYAQISYNKEVILAVKIEDGIDVTVAMTVEDQVCRLIVTDGDGNVLEEKTFSVETDKKIENTVHITAKEIQMIHANCHTKQCMYMKITRGFPSPIICTNGITVELIYDDVYDYIHII